MSLSPFCYIHGVNVDGNDPDLSIMIMLLASEVQLQALENEILTFQIWMMGGRRDVLLDARCLSDRWRKKRISRAGRLGVCQG